MWLINCRALTLEWFEHAEAPPYAILSHTWGDDEVSFHDFKSTDTREDRQGWRKIDLTCRQTLEHHLGYAWVDCCCINRDSSSELSESINSMFRWYSQSTHCYVFLADVCLDKPSSSPERLPDITTSHWFTRGWTLQELIAPLTLSFFDGNWRFMGTKAQFASWIASKTNIDRAILDSNTADEIRERLDECTVAMRMSWASRRRTKRPEDMAYCLLGLFDISMPMLYGEGERAFTRLQEEIIKDNNDMSIFAWQTSAAREPEQIHAEVVQSTEYRGIFAERPSEFSYGHHILQTSIQTINPAFALTNKGLRIETNIIKVGFDLVFLPMNYLYPSWNPEMARKVGICLRNRGDGVYVRLYPAQLLLSPSTTSSQNPYHRVDMFIGKHLKARTLRALGEGHRIQFEFIFPKKAEAVERVGGTWPSNHWDPVNGVLLVPSERESFVAFQQVYCKDYARKHEDEFLIVCGYEPGSAGRDGTPWVCLTTSSTNVGLYYAAKTFNMNALATMGTLDRNLKIKTSTNIFWRVKLRTAKYVDGNMRRTSFRLLMTEEYA